MVKDRRVLICTIPTNSRFSRLGRCGRESKAGEKWPPIRLMYLAGNLRKKLRVMFLDGDADPISREDFRARVIAFKPEFLIMEPVQNSFSEEMQEISFLRKHLNFKLIVTGAFVSAFREKLSEYSIDIIALGEPENNIKNYLLNNIKKGLLVKEAGKFKEYAGSAVIENLDSLESPAHDLINPQSYASPFIKSHPFTVIETSRGCPFPCTYCSVRIMSGRKTRFRSPENILKEIKWALSLGFKEIKFNDETFTLDRKRIISLLNLVKKEGLKFHWKCNSRADLLDEDLIRLMKETGCHLIFVGIESGNQKIIDYYKKSIKLEDIKKAFKTLNKAGMDTVAHFMIGAPEEDRKKIKESVNLARSLNATFTSFNILIPYPGTEIYSDLLNRGLFEAKDVKDADPLRNCVFKTKYLSSSALERELKRAYLRFYFSPSYLFKKIISIRSFSELKNSLMGARGLLNILR